MPTIGNTPSTVNISDILQTNLNTKVNRSGDTLTGNLNLNGNDIVNLNNLNDGALNDNYGNKLINGDFRIWSRGGTFTLTTNAYTSDRWRVSGLSGSTVTATYLGHTFGELIVPNNPRNYFRGTITTPGTATSINVSQRIEDYRTQAGRLSTLTFYIRGSSLFTLSSNSSFIQNFGTGGSPSASVTTPFSSLSVSTTSIGGSWTKVTVYGRIPSIAGKIGGATDGYLEVMISIPPISGLVFDIARVSLVDGDARLAEDPFSPRHLQQEFAMCMRYYETGSAYAYTYFQNSTSNANDRIWAYVNFKVPKAGTPTITLSASGSGAYSVAAAGPFELVIQRIGDFPAGLGCNWSADAEL